jgi:hypothetical protein
MLIGVRTISAAQVEAYRRFDGDIDGSARSGRATADMRDEDWLAIDELRRRLFIVASGRASAQFADEVEADLASQFPSEAARLALRAIVAGDVARGAGHPEGS